MSEPRPSSDVLVAHLEGEAVLLDLRSKSYFRLNATGATIWRALEEGKSREQIIAAMLEAYDVAPDVAAGAVDIALAELAERGLLQRASDGSSSAGDG